MLFTHFTFLVDEWMTFKLLDLWNHGDGLHGGMFARREYIRFWDDSLHVIAKVVG